MTFNRTAYGIEIDIRMVTFYIQILLIAPLMELKYIKPSVAALNYFSFNRTAYGIEIH